MSSNHDSNIRYTLRWQTLANPMTLLHPNDQPYEGDLAPSSIGAYATSYTKCGFVYHCFASFSKLVNTTHHPQQVLLHHFFYKYLFAPQIFNIKYHDASPSIF